MNFTDSNNQTPPVSKEKDNSTCEDLGRKSYPLTRLTRKVLRLKPDPVDLVPMRFKPVDNGNYLTMETPSKKERRQIREDWDAEGWRGKVAEKVGYLEGASRRGFRSELGRRWGSVKAYRGERRAKKLLENAHALEMGSMYLHSRDEWAVEGFLTIDGKTNAEAYPVVLILANKKWNLQTFPSYYEDEAGIYLAEDDVDVFWGEKIYLAADKFTEDNIKQVIQEWYNEKFSFTRGHHSHAEGYQIPVQVNLAWSDKSVEEQMTEEINELSSKNR